MSENESGQFKKKHEADAKARRTASKTQRKARESTKREKRSHESAHEFH
jgi:hypothetical protein